jgi:hypothetical protein
MEQKTMVPTMVPTMAPNNAHKDIPGNPSTAKSSAIQLNDRSNGKPLRVLSEDDWHFWKHNGYVVIKQAVSKEQAAATAGVRVSWTAGAAALIGQAAAGGCGS